MYAKGRRSVSFPLHIDPLLHLACFIIATKREVLTGGRRSKSTGISGSAVFFSPALVPFTCDQGNIFRDKYSTVLEHR